MYYKIEVCQVILKSYSKQQESRHLQTLTPTESALHSRLYRSSLWRRVRLWYLSEVIAYHPTYKWYRQTVWQIVEVIKWKYSLGIISIVSHQAGRKWSLHSLVFSLFLLCTVRNWYKCEYKLLPGGVYCFFKRSWVSSVNPRDRNTQERSLLKWGTRLYRRVLVPLR